MADIRTLGASALSLTLLLLAPLASAQIAPTELNQLWNPNYGGHTKQEGYLEFINQTEHPGLIGTPVPSSPPGVIATEEYTGYTTAAGNDVIEVGDSDTTAGDRADFDWVQENRPCETTGGCTVGQPVNHPGFTGAMGWTIGQTEASPHIDPGTGAAHQHSDQENPPGTLPHLTNEDFTLPWFNAVDVFSIISVGQDVGVVIGDQASMRAAALDYVLDFGNSVTGAFSPGVLSVVWIPGWTNATYIDNYVARWVPLIAGQYDLVAIEPGTTGDQVTEIDAIKALRLPEPWSPALFAIGLVALAWRARCRS